MVQIKADLVRCAAFHGMIVANINMLHMIPHKGWTSLTATGCEL